MSYSVPLKVKIRLTVYDKDPETNVSTIRDIKEEDVFFGEIPLMTDNGTFIINGTERVIVSQLHRSPGVFFKGDRDEYLAKIIPYRGSWVEFEYDQKGLLHARLGKRKIIATVFLRALGLWLNPQIDMKTVSDSILEEVVKNAEYSELRASSSSFTSTDKVVVEKGKFSIAGQDRRRYAPRRHACRRGHQGQEGGRRPQGQKDHQVRDRRTSPSEEATRSRSRRPISKVHSPSRTSSTQKPARSSSSRTPRSSPASCSRSSRRASRTSTVFFPKRDVIGEIIAQTLRKDPISKPVDALLEIYRKMRPGDPPTVPTAYRLLEGMFFDARRFDLSRVGRLKFNIKMGRPERDRLD